ncbi:DNA mismatch repair protein MutS [Desulfogranum marinum]|uniref:DNA mismatch repair protein MutS n=1 Tax=Desulfogranum marinum TaxID=453220 RepID=UPI0029C6DA74|nr:DNA mismatch repair protein MutS [Desulfogranum marinum]
MTTNVKITPMLRQYLEIKEAYDDAILFYRMGDFYEMFFDDAVTASKILGITLTSRSHKDEANKVPMCGIPFHALTGYLGKMIKSGHRVAICEQVEDPKQTKGIVKREVVRVVSPGVTTDEQILDEKTNCYVCALTTPKKQGGKHIVGLSFLDASTGEFLVTELPFNADDATELIDIMTRISPAELLLNEKESELQQALAKVVGEALGDICMTLRPDFHFIKDTAQTTLLDHFHTTNLAGFGCENFSYGICAAGALLNYIQDTQKSALNHIQQIKPLNQSGFLTIDDSSRRNLELTETIVGGKREGSLLAVLDFTATPMGARLLRKRLLFPLQDKASIERRLDAVEELIESPDSRKNLQQCLSSVYDLERLCSRLVLGQGNARDMAALKISLAQLPLLRQSIQTCSSLLFNNIHSQLDELAELHDLIDSSIRDDAPISLREGRLIKEGYNADLDELLILLRDDKQLILNLEAQERERSGISKLKVGYNKVFGYFFEITRSQAGTVPDNFIRKQTLVNAERFITPELKELENSIATAQEKRLELEYQLFSNIRQSIADQSKKILDVAYQVARIDFLFSLSTAAVKYRYRKPSINDAQQIYIEEGRHPVIERALEAGRFVPNDVELNDQQQLIIITGPNMAGKSTVLRQTALITLMTHAGSFVPARSASICIVDRIFTRVGAMDDLRRGQSTFMVEMNETANILNNATKNSLVILDEIGRGTSTYDGLAIAWAVAEALVNKDNSGIKTLFATHYHELTDLASSHQRVQNYSIAVREWNDTIIFLHKLVKGATNRSYGIQVASLAGVPEKVTQRAYAILAEIERGEMHHQGKINQNPGKQVLQKKQQPAQLQLFPKAQSPLLTLLTKTNPDSLSPRQALDLLYEMKELLPSES